MLAAFLTFCIPLETSSHTADLAQTHTQTHWEKYHKCINTLNYLLSHTNLWIASISAAEVAKKTEQNRTTLVGHGVLRRPTIHTEANLLFLSISPHTLFHKQSHTLDCHMGTHVKGWQRERGREKREKVPAANCLTKVSSTHIQIHPANSQPLLCKGGKADEEVMRGALWLWSPLIPFHFLPFLNVPIFSHFLLSFLLLHIIPCSLISNFSFTMTSSSPRPPHTYPMDWPQALLSPTLLFLSFLPFLTPFTLHLPFPPVFSVSVPVFFLSHLFSYMFHLHSPLSPALDICWYLQSWRSHSSCLKDTAQNGSGCSICCYTVQHVRV